MIKKILVVSVCILLTSIKPSDKATGNTLKIPNTAQQDRGSMTNLFSISPDNQEASPDNQEAVQSKENFLESSSSDDELPSPSKKLNKKDELSMNKRRNAVTSQSSILQRWKNEQLTPSVENSDYQSISIPTISLLARSHKNISSSSDNFPLSSENQERSKSDLGRYPNQHVFKPIKHRSDSFSE